MPQPPPSPNEPDALVGKVLGGRYLVQSLVDRGGMGKVYKAEQQPLGRTVALKTLDLMDPRGEFRDRFFNEASVASKLTHPNTVRIFDYGRSDEGVYFITMEFLEGQSLHALTKAEAPLTPSRVIHIARQVCGALDEAHDQGIVHRDLKPANVYLTRHGDDKEFAKVLDFGLVKDLDSDVQLSQTGQAMGSPLYMSPEQVEGERVDRRSDIYSLGLVMFVALTGRVPFKKGSIATIMMQQVTGTIPTFAEIAPDLAIPADLEWVVRRCIEKDRNKRFATMREVNKALKLVQKKLRGEISEPIEWRLSPAGFLALDGHIMDEESRVSFVQPPQNMPVSDIPSSPTLNRTTGNATIAVAGVAGMGLATIVLGGIAVAIVLVLLGLVAAIWFDGTEPVVPPRPDVVEVVPPAPVIPAGIEVEVTSEPPGAEVSRAAGALMGVTPLKLSVQGEAVTFIVSAEGHESREVVADGSVTAIHVPLKPKRPTIQPPPRPRDPQPTGPRPQLNPDRDVPKPTPATQPTATPNMTEIRDPWEDG